MEAEKVEKSNIFSFLFSFFTSWKSYKIMNLMFFCLKVKKGIFCELKKLQNHEFEFFAWNLGKKTFLQAEKAKKSRIYSLSFDFFRAEKAKKSRILIFCKLKKLKNQTFFHFCFHFLQAEKATKAWIWCFFVWKLKKEFFAS